MPEPSTDTLLPSADRARQERNFRLALMAAALVHAVLVVGVGRSLPRHMGEPAGTPQAVSVSLVDVADLAGKTGSARHESKTPVEPAAPAPRSAANAKPSDARALDEQSHPALPIDKEMLGSFSLPEPAGAQGKAADRSKDKSSAWRQLDLSLPPNPAEEPFSAPGWSGSATRPFDITRSGENDEFGRRVIRALRQTMPELRGIVGRVTVRMLLSESGNLVQVQLISSSGNPSLDQSVVFAVKQTSFPIPPAKATRSDRTFLVTYIYR